MSASFHPKSIPLPNERAALVVEVPPGAQPPYLYIPKGQVLVRTQTSSEPVPENDRADRVFFEVEDLAHGAVLEFEQLAGHGALQAVDAGDAVADFDNRADFADLHAARGEQERTERELDDILARLGLTPGVGGAA